jgi:LemA protein
MNRKVRALLGIAFLHLAFLFYTYNSFLIVEHEVHIADDNIKAQVQRKHDLLMNAVTAVMEYRDIERKIIKYSVEKRGKIGGININGTDEGLAALLLRLGILYEKYPDIKAVGTHGFLMKIIFDSGVLITAAREEYNRRALKYNLHLKMFPRKFIGYVMGFHEKDFFTADEIAHKVPNLIGLKEMRGI